jgi:chromosomal replication initiation ATPase DnaA
MQNAVLPNRRVETTTTPGAEILCFDPLRGRDRQAAHLVRLVAEASQVPAVLLLHPSRCSAEVAEARQLAMYLMHVILRRTYVEVGAYFRRDRTTVAHACARVEDHRDSSQFEAFVAHIEAALAAGEDRRDAAR